MPVGLPATGVLSYNGIVFDGASKISVTSETVSDEGNITITYVRYIILVYAVFQRTGGTDNTLTIVRGKLNEQGRQLIFRQKGFGNDLVVGPNGPRRDVRMGPKPKVLQWNPIGAHNACEVSWSVEVCVPECESGGAIRQSGISAFNYELDWDINEFGDTTRTGTGYIEIVQSRRGRQLADSADKYREALAAGTPLGFKRSSRFHLSKDKARLDFTIVDAQIPSNNAYPKNVTDIQGSHTVSVSRSQGGFKIHRNIIAVDVNMRRGISGVQAWTIFLNILRGRMRVPHDRGYSVFIDELSIDEEIFGRRCSFQAAYRIMDMPIEHIVYLTGLWEPLRDYKWRDWRESMKIEQSVRGTQGMFHNASADVIIDLCGGVPTASLVADREPPAVRAPRAPVLTNEKPKPEYSYLKYQAAVVPSRYRPVIRQSTLQSPESPSSGASMRFDPRSGGVTAAQGGFDYGPQATTADVLQERGGGRYEIRLVGEAVRAGYEIPRPELVQVQGYAVSEKASQFAMTNVGNFFGIPVFKAKWDVLYLVGKSPGPMSGPIQLGNVG